MKRWAARIIQLVISLALVLGIAECSIRTFAPQTLNVLRLRADGVYSHVPNADVMYHGPDSMARVRINSDGLRDVERPREKPEGVTRILMLGDSMIEGLQVELEDTMPKQLEARLSKTFPGRKFDVINAGVSGSTGPEALRYLERGGLDFDPDLLIVTITTRNDVQEAADTREIPRPFAYDLRVHLRSRYQLYSLFENAINANPRVRNALAAIGLLSPAQPTPAAAGVSNEVYLYDGMLEPFEMVGYERLFDSYEKMAALCRERNIPVLFVMIPSYFQATGYAAVLGNPATVGEVVKNGREVQDRMLAFFEQHGAAAADLLPDMKQDPEAYYLPTDRHFTAAGHASAAAATARALVERGMLAPRARRSGAKGA